MGDALGIVLPQEALAHLKAKEGDTLSVTESADGSLRVSSGEEEFQRQFAVGEKIMDRYKNALRELAK